MITADGPGTGRLVGFKRHLRSTVIPGEAAYLLSPLGVTALQGEHIELLAPLLDGSRTLADVVRDATPVMTAAQVGRMIGQLLDADLLAFRDGAPQDRQRDSAAEAYWDLAGLDGPLAAQALARTPVRLVSIGEVDLAAAREACRASALSTMEGGPCAQAAFTLVLCDDYLAPELAAIDAAQRAAGQAWLLAKPCGPQPWIGPVFQPGAGACWSCLAKRLGDHRRCELSLSRAEAAGARVRHPEASIAAARAVAIQCAVLESAKWLAGVRQAEQNAVFTLDTMTLRGTRHAVIRRPQCPNCGDPDLIAARTRRPIALRSVPKARDTGGGHRALSAEAMLERFKHLISPVTGITKAIRPAEGVPDFVNCYLSGPNLAVRTQSLAGLRAAGVRSQSSGKGVTPLEARVGALCEAAERYSAVRHGDELTIKASYRSLGEEAVHPDACQLFHERQFRDRRRWNAKHSAFQYVCEPFDERALHEWTPVWSLTGQTHRLLPTELLYFGLGNGARSGQLNADSNGNAAGSSLEDAIVQGFLELVERDAVALWWYNRTRQPGLDLDSFDEPWISELRARYADLGREIWALDLTSDLGIPVVAAFSRQRGGAGGRIVFGFGAHFDPRLALRRALTEMGQLFGGLLGGDPGATGGGEDPDLAAWWSMCANQEPDYLSPDPRTTPTAAGRYAYTPTTDLLDDVEAITALTRSHGLDLLVLDQTRPDLGIAAVKVIVPGLRHFWARFAPGRLYDVPVALHRLTEPKSYEDLNPLPLFV
ncbi:MAG TPA: TOMM precursor leader peptide-binding protein [Actinocrinis sp.]|nr:TOMM precursor leader peptide-binding protein [Actinocrinis sp.]